MLFRSGGFGGNGGGKGGKDAAGGDGDGPVSFDFLANDFHLPSKKWLVIFILVALLVVAGAYWWFHPAINIHSTDFWGFVFIVILLPVFLVLWTRSKQYKTGTKEVTKNEGKAKTFRLLSFIPVAVVALVNHHHFRKRGSQKNPGAGSGSGNQCLLWPCDNRQQDHRAVKPQGA